MIVVLRPGVTVRERRAVQARVRKLGNRCVPVDGEERSVLAVLGKPTFDPGAIQDLPGVVQVLRVGRPYKLASREAKQNRTVVDLGGGVTIGGERLVVMAGPCSVESRKVLFETARICADAGVTILRGGAFKPRTSPYSFQGLGKKGLELLAAAGERFNLKVVTEVMAPENVEIVAAHADIVQIGTRNMQNFDLLKECAQVKRPVLLKRGLAATIDEWLQSAEYILSAGKNPDVILCERGIRTFETATRNTLDLNALPVLHERTHLPVIVDPSHATGVRQFVIPMARAAVAAGADGIMVEVHPRPEEALSDGPQSLLPEQLVALLRDLQVISPVVGRHLDLTTTRPKSAVPRARATAGAGRRAAQAAFQGERGAFSEKAARQMFGEKESTLPCPSFASVFEAVARGKAVHGVVPVENTLAGSIHQNYDLLMEHDVKIVGELKLRISHSLIGHPGVSEDEIRAVYAHPQAAAQCENYLARKGWTVYQVYDTAGSVKMIKEEKRLDAAAIAAVDAAGRFDMAVLQEAIENDPRNYTRFVVIAAGAARNQARGAGDKVSLVYGTPNEPGALLRTLDLLAGHGVNLTKLESRPITGRPWEYLFYVDFVGGMSKALRKSLEAHTTRLKLLGVYPSCEPARAAASSATA